MWCPGCLISKSIWNEIKLMYPNIEYINYDYDLDEENIIKSPLVGRFYAAPSVGSDN